MSSRATFSGKSNQNAFIERYKRTFRNEVLDAHLFEDLEQVRELSAEWLRIYNEERPHDALGRQPPAVFRALIESKTTSTSDLSTWRGRLRCDAKLGCQPRFRVVRLDQRH